VSTTSTPPDEYEERYGDRSVHDRGLFFARGRGEARGWRHGSGAARPAASGGGVVVGVELQLRLSLPRRTVTAALASQDTSDRFEWRSRRGGRVDRIEEGVGTEDLQASRACPDRVLAVSSRPRWRGLDGEVLVCQ